VRLASAASRDFGADRALLQENAGKPAVSGLTLCRKRPTSAVFLRLHPREITLSRVAGCAGSPDRTDLMGPRRVNRGKYRGDSAQSAFRQTMKARKPLFDGLLPTIPSFRYQGASLPETGSVLKITGAQGREARDHERLTPKPLVDGCPRRQRAQHAPSLVLPRLSTDFSPGVQLWSRHWLPLVPTAAGVSQRRHCIQRGRNSP
jgi:hypothetical protein